MNAPLSTAALIAQARAFQKALLPDALIGDHSPATSSAREVCRHMIDAALLRDLDAAMKSAGMNAAREAGELAADQIYPARFGLLSCAFGDAERTAPKRYQEQAAWRDYSGWLCGSERMAQWIARWIVQYLAPNDVDGNAYGKDGRVRKIVSEGKADMWLAVSGEWKVAD